MRNLVLVNSCDKLHQIAFIGTAKDIAILIKITAHFKGSIDSRYCFELELVHMRLLKGNLAPKIIYALVWANIADQEQHIVRNLEQLR